MKRITKSDIEPAFRAWVYLMDGRIAASYNDVGGYSLTHSTVYGGWSIEQITNGTGGVRQVHYGRMPGRQFLDALQLAIASLRDYQNSRSYAEKLMADSQRVATA
tara:strand:+ start:857 stop:1171 length:315 start_codon:yes stop_codon:yes gene_type:complete